MIELKSSSGYYNSLGHDVEFIPFIAGKTDEFGKSAEDRNIIVWHYLVPEYESQEDNEE